MTSQVEAGDPRPQARSWKTQGVDSPQGPPHLAVSPVIGISDFWAPELCFLSQSIFGHFFP